MEKLEVSVTAQGNEVIVRTGAALPPEPKQSVKLDGTIESVLGFAKKRDAEINKLKSHVILNRKEGTVILVIAEDEEKKYTVSGKMIVHEFIEMLGINRSKSWTISDLINLFKLNRRFFLTRDDHAAMVAALTNFQAKTEIEFVQANDFKGSVANSKITKVKHEIPLTFTMKIPVFEGMEEQKFAVTIEVLPENGSLKCSFVSVEGAELIDAAVKETFDKVKTDLKEYVLIIQ